MFDVQTQEHQTDKSISDYIEVHTSYPRHMIFNIIAEFAVNLFNYQNSRIVAKGPSPYPIQNST